MVADSSSGLSTIAKRRALCVGVGRYTDPSMKNRNLRYAPADAQAIARQLRDAERGDFEVVLRDTPETTTWEQLRTDIEDLFQGQGDGSNELALLFISAHGGLFGENRTFYLLPSDAQIADEVYPRKVLDLYDLAGMVNKARVKNIVIWLDVCHAGGAGEVFSRLNFTFKPDVNIFIGGAARSGQTALQLSQIKHGVYTDCLLKAFEQCPDAGDGTWLSVAVLQRHIEREIDKFNRQEDRNEDKIIQFPGTFRFLKFGLPVIQNPACSVESIDFHKQVAEILELNDYQPQSLLPADLPDSPPGFYIAKRERDLYGILTVYNRYGDVTPEFIHAAATFMKVQFEGKLRHLLVVSYANLNDTVQAVFKEILGPTAFRFTDFEIYNELLHNLLPGLDIFVEHWRREFEEEPRVSEAPPITLKRVYTPVWAEKRQIKSLGMLQGQNFDLFAKDKLQKDVDTGELYKVEETGLLQEMVEDWLAAPGRPRLALLGSYGTGKSTFCLHLVAQLSAAYRADKPGRIPLYIQLRRFAEGVPNIRRIAEFIGDTTGQRPPTVAAIRKLAEQGRLLFILDGFDEMAAQADEATVRRNILMFEELAAIPDNKLLLATRSEYFVNHKEEADILKQYERLYLQPYTPEQILAYLIKRFGEKQAQQDWEYLQPIHDLPDLATRPIFLTMIAQTLPQLRELSSINRPLLYETYLKDELKRQEDKRRVDLKISFDKRFRLDEEIALYLYRTGRFQEGLDEAEVVELFRDSPLLTAAEKGLLARTTREIISCSFLIKPSAGKFYFSHRSFLEYFLALALRRQMLADNRTDFELHDLYEVAAPTLEFLAEMINVPISTDVGWLDKIEDLRLAKEWLVDSTTNATSDGEIEWGNLQKNVAGLILACRTVGLPPHQLSGLVTRAEYQLFVEERQKYKQYCQPGHWQSYRFAPGTALEPVQGILLSQARWFTSWLDRRFKSSFMSSLPYSTDKSSLFATDQTGYWTTNGDITGLLVEREDQLQQELAKFTCYKELNLAHALDLDLNLDLDGARILNQALARILELDFDRNRDRAGNRALAIERTIALASGLVLDGSLVRSVVRAFDLTRIGSIPPKIFGKIEELLWEGQSESVIDNVISELDIGNWKESEKRIIQIIRLLLKMEAASDFRVLSRAHRNYVSYYADLMLSGFSIIGAEGNHLDKYEKNKELMGRLQGWVEMMEARIMGDLPAWEGLRFVRIPKV